MKMKNWKRLTKGVAIAQAIVAPGLIVIGKVTNNEKMKKIGIGWCAIIALDTARTTWHAVDWAYQAEGLDDVIREEENED